MFPLAPSSSDAPVPRRTSLLRRILLFAAGLLALWLLVQLVPAAPAEPAVQDASSYTGAPAAASFSILSFGNLAALLLLIGGGVLAVYLRRQKESATGGTSLQPLEQLPLAQNQQLRLVACGDEVLLLSATAEQVRLLKTYPRAAFADHPALCPEAPAATSGAGVTPSFSHLLRQYVPSPADA